MNKLTKKVIEKLLRKSFKKNSKINFLGVTLITLCFCSVTSSYAALEATSLNTIKGTLPYAKYRTFDDDGNIDRIKIRTDDDALRILVWKGNRDSDGNEILEQVKTNARINTPVGMKFSHVIAIASPKAPPPTPNSTTYAFDDDGDIANGAYFNGYAKAEWKTPDGILITGADLEGELIRDPCFTDSESQYKFTVSTNNLYINSPYGDPKATYIGTKSINYSFVPPIIEEQDPGICFFKPANMQTYSNQQHMSYANGYNPDKWRSGKGFKPGSGFPTTGFKHAKFTIVSSAIKSEYRCISTDREKDKTKIKLVGETDVIENCIVEYIAEKWSDFTKYGTTPTIKLQKKTSDNNWQTIDTYTIPTPKLWAIFPTETYPYSNEHFVTATSFPALDACRDLLDPEPTTVTTKTTKEQAKEQDKKYKDFRRTYLYKRNELTNSTNATSSPENNVLYGGYLSRDTGTFLGEWGYIFNYPDSGWASTTDYWTAETYSKDTQAGVHARGTVYNSHSTNPAAVPCRGEPNPSLLNLLF